MNLIDYWPDNESVNACIKPEAEGASSQVLLAVHQPAPLVYKLAKSEERIPTSEAELFDYVTSKDVPTGAHVVPITGDSGVGKSHLVRLIAARLEALPNADRYVPVRIPKSASLRKVVEEILKLLTGDSYDAVRKAFKEAFSDVDPDNSTIRFQSALDISLKDLSRELKAGLQQDPTNQELRQKLDHAQRLPLLLSDAVTREYFRSGPLYRIVQGALSGRQDAHDNAAQQFSARDLDLPPDMDLTKAAEQVNFYYRTALQAREGHGKKIAVEVLNSVLDAAIRQLFHLNDSLGGMTLQEVILAIRTQMLTEGRELVILVEDFRALTGIQETLLNVLIQEGVRDGQKIYATMRSVIAVTEGYLTARETIATRATREWIILKDLPGKDEEVHRRTRELVAAYLNAARWGEDAIIRGNFREKNTRTDSGIGVPLFSAKEGDTSTDKGLQAFGKVAGVPLFPFTSTAIEYFSNIALKEGNALVFKPRAIITFVRDVLLFGREPFSAGIFPPTNIKARAPTEDVAQWLSGQRLSQEQRERYERVVVIWGNNPQDRNRIALIPSEIFASFSLPPPLGLDGAPKEFYEQPKATPAPQKNVPATPDDRKVIEFANYGSELESWIQRDGPELGQGTASAIRSALSAALNERIDWNAERCLKLEIAANQISIPHARGKGGEACNTLLLTTDRSDPDGQLRRELRALLRFYQIWKKDLSYLEIEDDMACISNLADRLLPAALSLVRAEALRRTTISCALLSANSRLLGITDGGRTPRALHTFLFDEVPELVPLPEFAPESFTNWTNSQQKAAAIRPHLVEAVLQNCGCFQGTGKRSNGVDIIRVAQAFSDDTQTSAADIASFAPELKGALPELAESRSRPRARHAATEAIRIRTQLETALGPSFEKNAPTDAMLELAEELRQLGAWSESDLGLTFPAFKTLSEEFRACPLKDALDQLSRINLTDDTTTAATLISQVAKVKLRALVTSHRFVTTAERVVKYADRHAKGIEDQFKGVSAEAQADHLIKEFDRIISDLNRYQPTESKHAAAKRA